MTGVSIDHMVALTVLIAVLMVSMTAFGQIIGASVLYQQNHEVSMKAAELASTLLLNPGEPIHWGQSNDVPSAFGLQDSSFAGYSLDAFSISRLSSTQPLVYFNKTGLWYSNNSWSGGSLLVPLPNVVNYTLAARLLGVEGSYAFRLAVTPTLNVFVYELNVNPLNMKVEVASIAGSLKNVALDYFLYCSAPRGAQSPLIQSFSGAGQTDSNGSAILEFPFDGSHFAYSIIVYAHVAGLSGVGYRSHDTIADNKIVPFIEDFENRVILLAHSWDLQNFQPPTEALYFNATFLSLAHDFRLSEIQMVDSGGFVRAGLVNYGENYQNVRLQIPTQNAGILIIAYSSGDYSGIVAMPWGISALGFSVVFGGDPTQADWVVVEVRQVSINRISYHVKVAVWKTTREYTRFTP